MTTTENTAASGFIEGVLAFVPRPASLFIHGENNRLLAELKPDGTLVVEKEDATEAAAVFWNAVRGHMEASFKAYVDQRDNSPA